jgi:hypothetical protein
MNKERPGRALTDQNDDPMRRGEDGCHTGRTINARCHCPSHDDLQLPVAWRSRPCSVASSQCASCSERKGFGKTVQ